MKKKTSPYYSYMAPYFERGNKDEIEMAKKNYRSMYKRVWRKMNENKMKEVKVRLRFKDYTLLQKEAKLNGYKLAPFIKMASIAYAHKTFIMPEEEALNKILQLLKMCYLKIQDMREENQSINPFLISLENLERDIRAILLNPFDITKYIRSHLIKTPEDKYEFLTLILSL